MKKLLFIFNPNSGKGLIKRKIYELTDIFTKGGYVVSAYPTQSQFDGYNFIKKLDDEYDLIVCAGGDGTLNEVVRAVNEKNIDIPIGYIPCGSTNDFASSVGIHKTNATAAKQILDGRPQYIDVGQFNDSTFNYVAAFGAFTDVAYATSQELKNVIGHSAYVVEGIKRLLSLKSYKMSLNCDGEIIKGDFIYGMVSNSCCVAGIKGMMGKNVKLNDGLLEATFIRNPKNPLMVEQLMAGIIMQNLHEKKDICITRKIQKMDIISKENVSWTLDGEYGGDLCKVKIEVVHDAYRLVTTKKI